MLQVDGCSVSLAHAEARVGYQQSTAARFGPPRTDCCAEVPAGGRILGAGGPGEVKHSGTRKLKQRRTVFRCIDRKGTVKLHQAVATCPLLSPLRAATVIPPFATAGSIASRRPTRTRSSHHFTLKSLRASYSSQGSRPAARLGVPPSQKPPRSTSLLLLLTAPHPGPPRSHCIHK